MVLCYAAAVKRTQPTGPHTIASYSHGDVVMFEVTQRIEAMGDEVKFVGLINIPPHITDRMHEIDWTGGMLSLSYFLGLLTPAKLDHGVDIVWSLIECGEDYNPSGSVSAVNVFYAILLHGSNSDWLNNQPKPWSGFSHGEPSYMDVPGQHYTLMDFDHVPQFRKIFCDHLRLRQSPQPRRIKPVPQTSPQDSTQNQPQFTVSPLPNIMLHPEDATSIAR
ncbi:hypothetical protein CY34DRAFT_94135 [Suillus luteus UH-Slu-Lm8-n1]|uniref:Thioesterase domain-containing protein n=1 Tax=Suillus luteus UH-Slu-Lm8-n1 TaxID=930992 RepID=A0A0D0AXH8_9AGAM|nr:hypothetical protein CY34DRAFT_94135 [Suillus luteus UH-Slu-Lm8-n1]